MKDAIVNALVEVLKKLSSEELVEMWNAYADHIGFSDCNIHEMDEFNDFVADMPPLAVAGNSYDDGENGKCFDSNAPYFVLDSYGRFFSMYDPIESPRTPFSWTILARHILKDKTDFGCKAVKKELRALSA